MKGTRRFDPRPKIILLAAGAVFFFLPLRLEVLGAGLMLLLVPGGLVLKTRLLRVLSSILPILILVALLTPFFYRQGTPIWQMGETVVLTLRGLEETGRLLIRFTGITAVFALFYLTTPAERFLSALEWYGLPFRAALVMSLTLRFIPSLFTLYQRVEDAHSLRRAGELADRNGFFRRFRNLLPTLTSVLIQAVKKIGPLSMSLELQGVGLSSRRTRFVRLPRFRDVAFQFLLVLLILSLLVTVLVIFPQLWYNGAS